MSDETTTTPHDLNYELIAAETDDDMAEAAIKALLDKVAFLQEQADTFRNRNEELVEELTTLKNAVIGTTDELNAVKADLATATDNHAKATAANAEIARERDAAKALCETALKAQKRAEDAAANADRNETIAITRMGELSEQLKATDAAYLKVCAERDEWKRKHTELSKGAQAFVGAASKPTGPATIRTYEVNKTNNYTEFVLPPGATWLMTQVNETKVYETVIMPIAVAQPVDETPEQEHVEDVTLFSEAAA